MVRAHKFTKLLPRGHKFINNVQRRGHKFVNHLMNSELGKSMKGKLQNMGSMVTNAAMERGNNAMSQIENNLKRKLGEY